jgi:hypothetical protein
MVATAITAILARTNLLQGSMSASCHLTEWQRAGSDPARVVQAGHPTFLRDFRDLVPRHDGAVSDGIAIPRERITRTVRSHGLLPLLPARLERQRSGASHVYRRATTSVFLYPCPLPLAEPWTPSASSPIAGRSHVQVCLSTRCACVSPSTPTLPYFTNTSQCPRSIPPGSPGTPLAAWHRRTRPLSWSTSARSGSWRRP